MQARSDLGAALTDKLAAALSPAQVEVVDESHKHRGHAGARPEGQTHFRITVVSAAFEGKSRVARQRLVYETLRDELAGPVHALSLRLLTPGEGEGG